MRTALRIPLHDASVGSQFLTFHRNIWNWSPNDAVSCSRRTESKLHHCENLKCKENCIFDNVMWQWQRSHGQCDMNMAKVTWSVWYGDGFKVRWPVWYDYG